MSAWHRVLTALGTALLVIAPSAGAQSGLARYAFGKTVLLVLEDENGQPSSMGSGFFVQDSVVVTSLHVLQGAKSGYAKLMNEKTRYEIQGILATDPDRDLALLLLSLKNIVPLQTVSVDTIEVADTIYAVGNDGLDQCTFFRGIVSAIRLAGKDKLLQITAPISPGSSGGPVLNTHGQVVGVAVATYVEGQNLSFAIPADYLVELQKAGLNLRPISSASAAGKTPSILSKYEGTAEEYVSPTAFAWIDNQFMGYYNFSVRNSLRQAIRDVVCIVIFYGNDGAPIETETVQIPGPIRAGLAERSTLLGRIDAHDVRNLTTKTEIRVLTYQFVN
ncbi:MAG: S1C family serine protease [Deltaproteobacteria bacterium]|nr:S1C family serine protease [Deltaproteobacteria bacterium]